MESKKLEKPCENATFQALQGVMKPDEETGGVFSPDETLMDEIKALCEPVLAKYHFIPVFFDITRTGRHLWIAVYFHIGCDSLAVNDLSRASAAINAAAQKRYQDCTCELILTPEGSPCLDC